VKPPRVQSFPRSAAYDHVTAWLPAYVNDHGKLPSYLTVLTYLREVHNLGSSSSTVKRILDGWQQIPANLQLLDAARQRVREQFLRTSAGAAPAIIDAGEGSAIPASLGAPGVPAADPLLAATLSSLRDSVRAEERRRAEQVADERVANIQAVSDEAVRQAKLSEERAVLLLQQAEAHRSAAEASAAERTRDADARVSEARIAMEALQKQHSGERAADRVAAAREAAQQVDEAVLPLREAIARLEQRLVDADARETALQGQVASLTEQLLAAERGAAAQHSEITRHWAGELSRSRDETAQVQTALRKAVAEKEDAVRLARQETTGAIVQSLNALRESVGGVNAVHNTHLGTITARIEELAGRVATLLQQDRSAKRPKSLQRQTSR